MTIRYGNKTITFKIEGTAKKINEIEINFEIATNKGIIKNSDEQSFNYEKNDYIVSVGSDKWVVNNQIFKKTYKIISPSKDNKLGKAIKTHQPDFMIAKENGDLDSLEGKNTFVKGDYIMSGINKENWVIKKDKFEKTYCKCSEQN